MIGTSIAHYTITEKIGQGGMGEVYRATDTKLDRDVALKVLPEAFAQDQQRMARFAREAKVLASLNHPNIATIHGLEESDGKQALVLELVEGEDLAERIKRGAIPLEEALKIALQIAEALEAAHEKGIIHRDLKPANVKITPEGVVKVLDFGLAKAMEDEVVPEDISQSPTISQLATKAGIILGTAAYMSPEQARGKRVDKRTDIWAFGVVLYEMLTGKMAFQGEDISLTLAAVMTKEPDWGTLPAQLPVLIKSLLSRCLTRDSKERLRDIGEARISLSGYQIDPSSYEINAAVVAKPSWWRRSLPQVAAVVVGVLATVLVFWFVSPRPSSAPLSPSVSRATISLADGQRQPRWISAPLAISPDGTLLAYVGRDRTGSHLFLRPLGSFESTKVPGSEYADAPFFSPNGDWVGFFTPGKLKKVSVSRGSPIDIANVASSAFGASWGRGDVIVFARNLSGGLWRVSADGGTPEQLTRPDFGENGYAHVWPQHLPDGRHVLFLRWGADWTSRILDLETGRTTVARPGIVAGDMYLPSGHLTYADTSGSGSLLVAPFDLQKLAVSGSAIPVLDDVRHLESKSARPYIAVSQSGTAVYVTSEIGEATLMWADRDGDTTPILSREGNISHVRLSPDGDTAVFDDEQQSLWSLDIQRGSVDILANRTNFETGVSGPIWHPDGERVTVSSNEAGSWDLYEIDVAERGQPLVLLVREYDQFPYSWSRNGRLLSYVENHPETGNDIWVLPRDEEPVPILQTGANETNPVFSPDGRFLAYVSNESGQLQVYLRSYPEGKVLGVSLDGGEEPVWSRDGGELFFRQGDQLFAVTFTTEPEMAVSAPTVLFELPFDRSLPAGSVPYYDVSPDSQSFLVVSERPTTEFKVIQNWFEELKRLVPTE